jgi:hypothetical protein
MLRQRVVIAAALAAPPRSALAFPVAAADM